MPNNFCSRFIGGNYGVTDETNKKMLFSKISNLQVKISNESNLIYFDINQSDYYVFILEKVHSAKSFSIEKIYLKSKCLILFFSG